jgi:hypothetical protein
MKHFLITRFNLKNSYWKKPGEEYDVLTEDWLNHRFSLFENYCLPSVLNQTNKNFIWLIAFDIDTPEVFKKKIQSIFKEYTNFYPLFIDGFFNLQLSLKTEIKRLTTKQDKYIITTRLDNDDVIHKDFIKTIQHLFIAAPNTIIDLRRGYQLIAKDSPNEVRVFNCAYNPFISLVESITNFESVISKEHHEWKKGTSKLVNTKDYLWIQLVHDKNQSNKKDYSLRKIAKLDFQDFGINLQPVEDNPIFIIIYNALLYPYRIFIATKKSIKDYLT